MSSDGSDTLSLFPLSHGVFPDGQLRLQIFEPRYLDLIKRCHRNQAPFGVVWLKQGREVQTPGDSLDFYATGCLAHIRSYTEVQPALLQIICQGGLRFDLLSSSVGSYGVWQGQVSYLPADTEQAVPAVHQIHADRLGRAIAQAQDLGMEDRLPWFAPYRLDDAGWLANRYAEVLPLESALKVALLAETDPLLRLDQVMQALPPSS